MPKKHPNQRNLKMEKRYNMGFVWMICLIAALGGLLFGYDWVVIGGAKPFFVKFFHLEGREDAIGWAMSSALVGCIGGSIVSGMASDKFGRKRLLILSGFLFTLSAILTGLANDFNMFIWARIIGGVGIGLASNLSPMYIAETSPAEMRGKFVSINQLTIVAGVVLAQVVNWMIAQNMPANFTDQQIMDSWYGQYGWRWMFAAETVPASMFFIMMFFIPESPRWLVKNGKIKDAEKVLGRVGGDDYARSEVEDIRKTLENETGKVRFGELLESRMAKVVLIGVFLAALQQWCGINVLFYYAEDVFKAAGYDISGIMLNIVTTGLVMLVFTFVAIFTVDRLGRRFLLILGVGGLTILYAAIGACYHFDVKGVSVLILVLAAIACYSFSLAPVTWVLLSELFPNRIRGAAMSISVFVLWLTCWALAQGFPKMNAYLGPDGSFWAFGVVCFLGTVFILFAVPETKGKSLEDIERELVD